MDDTPPPARPEAVDDWLEDEDDFAAPPETEEEEQRRLAWEAEMIAEAEAELAAGYYVDGDEVLAWLKNVGTDNELPPPPVRRR